MSKEKDKIIEKIQKLLTLSKSDNQHEADLAMFRAQQMMQKYQMEMSDVLLDIESSDIIEEKFTIDGKKQTWFLYLANHAAKLFDGQILGKPTRRGTTMTFIGSKESVSAAKAMFQYLIKTWKSMVEHDLTLAKQSDGEWQRGDTLRFKTAHGVGFQQAVGKRVKEILAQRTKEFATLSGCTALVPVMMKEAIDEYLNETHGKLGKVSRCCARDRRGYESGQYAGKNVALNGAIG